jgi:hypothetical protein
MGSFFSFVKSKKLRESIYGRLMVCGGGKGGGGTSTIEPN